MTLVATSIVTDGEGAWSLADVEIGGAGTRP